MTVVDRTSSEFATYLELYERAALLELGAAGRCRALAAAIPTPVVTYIIDRNINYTNVCVADCGFCAFYRRPEARRGLRAQLRADRRARSTSARRSAACRSCCRAGTTRTSRSSGTST